MPKPAQKNRVIITGGSRGIGRGIAHVLGQAGYKVTAIGKSQKARYLKPDIGYLQADLSTPGGVERACQLIDREPPAILVNCLGIEKNGYFTDLKPRDYRKVMDTNVTCHVELSRRVIPYMQKEKWGRIIFITSIWASTGTHRRAVYTMSKFALEGLAMSLADEYASDGIRVNCVAPGFIYIDETSLPGRGKQRNNFLAKMVPAGRLGRPEEIGDTVKWLVSKEADYVSGQVIVVDGGFLNSGSRGCLL